MLKIISPTTAIASESTIQATRITIQERSERSFLTRLLHAVLKPFKPFKPSLTKPGKLPPEPTRLTATKRAKGFCEVAEQQVDGIWVYNLTRKALDENQDTTKASRPQRILYFAGGGGQMPPSDHHWAFCAELVRRLPDTRVTLVSSPLAPRSPVSVAFPQIERAYKTLMAESTKAGENVTVAGDSSGGSIALCLVAWALRFQEEESSRAPVAVFVISPTTDLRHELDAIKEAGKVDPIHTHECIRETARTWCPGAVNQGNSHETPPSRSSPQRRDWSFEDPRVSPIQADLTHLVWYGVSVHGLTGSYDVLEPEAVFFRDKCRDVGVTGEWLSWHGQMHCFPLTFRYGLKESKEAMDWIVGVLEKH